MSRRIPRILGLVAVVAAAFCATQCQSAAAASVDRSRSAAAWGLVYEVLQHPRCLNCHPAGDRPLVGEHGEPHPQNVQRGSTGMGLFAMTCPTCHRDENTAGEHMPPGAPRWHLPPRNMPLVFEGRSPAQLARQLADPAQNGDKSPSALLQHVTEDPLVLWGWKPGLGREPVPVPHAEFVAAFRTWVDGGCQVPQ
ncbi:MAG TPA: hypothetical protein VFZ65_16330 [Planctomycetota bacterium]|nr:hypothetical protein [Planctomycetota bacterium]